MLTVGYHGYHDWFAFDWPNPGVPQALKQYIHDVPYGDIEAADKVFDAHGTELAAAITVPVDWRQNPDGPFLQHLRNRCTEFGIALIFDEILTGFRLAKGGAVDYFGIQPDMAGFAKGMANGYPAAAYTGSAEWMDTLDQTIITTTYAGETLSLAATCAVMDVFKNEPVHDHLKEKGQALRSGFEEIFRESGFPVTTIGVDQAHYIDFSPAGDDAESLHVQLFNKLFQKGIFASEEWFITYAHQDSDINQTLDAMRQSVAEII